MEIYEKFPTFFVKKSTPEIMLKRKNKKYGYYSVSSFFFFYYDKYMLRKRDIIKLSAYGQNQL